LALDWLAKEQQLVDDAALVEPARSRFLAWALYLRGRIHLELGEAQEAEEAFALMLEKAESIRWQRAAIYAQLGLADAAVKLGKLDVARNLLREGLPVAERNKDRRCTASYQKALGNLAGERGQHAEALAWARKAKTNFDRLGIYPESAELDLLIAEEEERIKD
jgi:tetratricopeptide (TPR) repeat protein